MHTLLSTAIATLRYHHNVNGVIATMLSRHLRNNDVCKGSEQPVTVDMVHQGCRGLFRYRRRLTAPQRG